MLNLSHTALIQDVNGPGLRYSLWVRGCPLDCPGCFNPALRASEPAAWVEPAELARRAAALAPFDGVTLSGGEPFAQPGALAEFLEALETVMGGRPPTLAFTGQTLEALSEAGPDAARLLARVDLLVDGPYRADLPPGGPLRGSSNQRLIALTPEGLSLREAIERSGSASAFGVLVTDGGEVLVTGFPPPEALRRLRGAFR